MTAFELRKYPDPVLLNPSATIKDFSGVEHIVEALKRIMTEHAGGGLAGPQIGVSRRIFVMNPTGDPKDFMVCINPVIESLGSATKWGAESCLSLPGTTERILRHTKISVRYQTASGAEITKRLKHWGARVFQHELDHLDGILITTKQKVTHASSPG
jgi:peptide deformylase